MNLVIFTSRFSHTYCLPTRTKETLQNSLPENTPETSPKLGITLISHAALRVAVCYPGVECFIIVMMTLAARKTDPEIELTAKLVPPEDYDYLMVFSETEACALPPQCYKDHVIPLVDGGKPPFGRMY